MDIHLGSEFWSALEAIGTVTAATLALFFWLWAEHLKPWLQSPKLSIEFENIPPWLKLCDCPHDFAHAAPMGHWIARGDTVRVRILNKGKSTAHMMLVRAMNVYDGEGNPIGGVDPVSLRWSGAEAVGYLPLLGCADYEYVDMFGFEWRQDFTFHIIADADSRCDRRGLQPGEYYVTLAVFADDAKARERIFRIVLGEIKPEKEDERGESRHYFEMKPVKKIRTRR